MYGNDSPAPLPALNLNQRTFVLSSHLFGSLSLSLCACISSVRLSYPQWLCFIFSLAPHSPFLCFSLSLTLFYMFSHFISSSLCSLSLAIVSTSELFHQCLFKSPVILRSRSSPVPSHSTCLSHFDRKRLDAVWDNIGMQPDAKYHCHGPLST